MKKQSIVVIFVLVAAALLLSACGTLPATSWPGISASDETAYMASGQYVYAVRLSDGSELWRYPAKVEKNNRQFYAAPALADGLVVAGDYSGGIVGLDPANGSELWRQSYDNKFIASPVVVGDTILAANANGTLYALDFKGNEKWSYVTSSAIWSKVVSDGSKVYLAGMDHQMHAIDLLTGKEAWSTDLGAACIDAPAISEDALFIATLANEIISVNFNDGSINWRKDFPNHLWTRPRLAEGALYFGDTAGIIYKLNAVDGSEVWQLTVGDANGAGVVGEPIEIPDGLAFATQNGKIFKVNPNQERLGTLSITGKLYSGPVYVPGITERLLVGVVNGEAPMVALDKNGTELWSFVPAK